MKTLILAAMLVLAAICFAATFVAAWAADKPPITASTNAAATAKDQRDRRTMANEFTRKVDKLSAADIATVRAILDKYPPQPAPRTNAPALKK
jgi:parvulin-like peptidyl-prolyl isomerase